MSKHDHRTDLWIQIASGDRHNELCSLIRGLFQANGNSAGQITRNANFKKGLVVSFGTSPKAQDFIDSVKFFVKKKVRVRITMYLHG